MIQSRLQKKVQTKYVCKLTLESMSIKYTKKNIPEMRFRRYIEEIQISNTFDTHCQCVIGSMLIS